MGKPPGKKPPAPSVSRRPTADIKAQIAAEIYTILKRHDADDELLAIVGSWRDTLNDREVLRLLREWNRIGKVLHRRQ